MALSFQLLGINHKLFEPLFQLSDEQLKDHSAKRCIATESPATPAASASRTQAWEKSCYSSPIFTNQLRPPTARQGLSLFVAVRSNAGLAPGKFRLTSAVDSCRSAPTTRRT
jgi:hypothetical protein